MSARLSSLLRSWRTWVVVGAVVLIGVLALQQFKTTPEEIRLDRFTAALNDGRVKTAEIQAKPAVVTGKLTNGTEYITAFPPDYAEQLTTQLLKSNVDVSADNGTATTLMDLALSLIPTLLVVGVFLWFAFQMQGGGRAMKFGRARARLAGQDDNATFADVAGADEAVTELGEIVEFLKDPARFTALGARIPKGVLLCGPPGTGKTLLARSVAGEAGVPFLTISGSDFVEMFVGVGASRVRDLFKQAVAQAPAIIFVDEIDAVGRHRGTGVGGGHDEREQTLNQLLVEMDGFDGTTGVILMAATNRPDILDPALLRPGRFDRQIVVDAPDVVGRIAILEVHARNKPLDESVDLSVLARRTPGFTGADLANVLNEGALLAARRSSVTIGQRDLTAAVDRVLAGPERTSRVIGESERRTIAVHEAGHALVGHVLPHADEVHKISIVARGSALGFTIMLPEEDRHLHTRSELADRLAMTLGGRSAEEVVFGEITTGAADDIEQATRLARAMVTEFGMSDKLGPQRFTIKEGEPFLGREHTRQSDHSDDLASRIDDEITQLLDDAHERARGIIEAHRSTIDALADALLERETIADDELGEFFSGLGPATSH